MRLRSATMLSRQQQTGVLETIDPPSLRPLQPSPNPNQAILRRLWLNDGTIHELEQIPLKFHRRHARHAVKLAQSA